MNALTRVGPGIAVGVTEDMIAVLVHEFYAKVRRDPILGPIFEQAIGDHWDAHLAKLADFWSSVMLMTGRFKGAPMAVHAEFPEIGPQHFARWLQLFGETTKLVCPPAAAALFEAKAAMIAQSLQLGISARKGELPPMAPRPSDAAAPGLPEGLEAYRRTPIFTEETIPVGLRRAHSTKTGTWAEIHVLEGRLLYRISDPRRPPNETVLSPSAPPGIVEPTVLHEVEPQGALRFYVEFYRRPADCAEPDQLSR
jgi:hemoglobin